MVSIILVIILSPRLLPNPPPSRSSWGWWPDFSSPEKKAFLDFLFLEKLEDHLKKLGFFNKIL